MELPVVPGNDDRAATASRGLDGAPVPYRPPSPRYAPPGRLEKLLAGFVALTLAAVLSLARSLTPAPGRGEGLRAVATASGTHRGLGLPPCGFLDATGLPCPSCGMTTAFAHGARLELIAAFVAQPFGGLTFVLSVASLAWMAAILLWDVPFLDFLDRNFTRGPAFTAAGLALASWLYKMVAVRWL